MTENEAIKELLYQEKMRSKGIDYQVNNLVIGTVVEALKEIQQYRAIGTVEECREARERQIPKKLKSINKVDEDTIYMECANCGLTTVLYRGMEPYYCPKCGQNLDWSE